MTIESFAANQLNFFTKISMEFSRVWPFWQDKSKSVTWQLVETLGVCLEADER